MQMQTDGDILAQIVLTQRVQPNQIVSLHGAKGIYDRKYRGMNLIDFSENF